MKRDSKENIKEDTISSKTFYEEMPQINESKANTC